MRLKAFLFTLDALLAIALLSVATYSFIIFSQQQTTNEKFFGLEQLGRDFIKLQRKGLADESLFKNLTGLNASLSKNAFPNAALVAHAAVYAYPAVCGGKGSVGADDACLTTQDIGIENNSFYYEAWVTP